MWQMRTRHYKDVLSWCIRDESGRIVDSVNPYITLPHASVGKVLLLIETARQIQAGVCDPSGNLHRTTHVRDSGLWQHMTQPVLTVHDACVLIGSVSDNMATNALIDLIGLESIQHMREEHLPHLPSLELCDVVREHRGSTHPAELSKGSTFDWSQLVHDLRLGLVISPDVSNQIRTWLALSVDHSMVLAPFAFDPLLSDIDICFNKTGSDVHVRADAGVVYSSQRFWTYSACVSPVTNPAQATEELRAIGLRIQQM
jgi:beta-lactamase class A